jgi:hypothetical protein
MNCNNSLQCMVMRLNKPVSIIFGQFSSQLQTQVLKWVECIVFIVYI